MSDVVAPEVREMAGRAALPRQNGELVFDAPWQGRVLGLAIGITTSLGTGWETFRQELIRAIAQDEARPYYESWLAALEDLVVEQGLVDHDELARRAAANESEPG